MSDESVILINLLKVKPGKHDALIAFLRQNTNTVVRTRRSTETTWRVADAGANESEIKVP